MLVQKRNLRRAMIGLGLLAAVFLALAVLLAVQGGQWYAMIAFSLIPVALAGLFSWNERWWRRAVCAG